MQVFTWQQMVEQLIAFIRQFGHCHVPPVGLKTPAWPSGQSATLQRSPAFCGKKRNNSPTGFSSGKPKWKRLLKPAGKTTAATQSLCLQHGHCRVPGGTTEWKSRRSWVDRQRRIGNNCLFTNSSNCSPSVFFPAHRWRPGRAAVGTDVRPTGTLRAWSLATQGAKAWLADEELAAGWPAENLSPSLTPERKRRLNRLGFASKKTSDRPKKRNGRVLSATQAFQAQYGHCRVPDQYADIPRLGKWVSWQRKQQAKLSRSADRSWKALQFVFTIERGQGTPVASGSACTAN